VTETPAQRAGEALEDGIAIDVVQYVAEAEDVEVCQQTRLLNAGPDE
jgi:hypothetical protein